MKSFQIEFIRQSDGAKRLFEPNRGITGFALRQDQKVITAPDIDTASYKYAGMDGVYITNQLRRSRPFDLSAYIFDNSISVAPQKQQEILEFFRINESYIIVFYPCDDEAYQLTTNYIIDGPHITDHFDGVMEVDVSFMSEDPNLYRYRIDPSTGEIIYTTSIIVPVEQTTAGGRVWGEDGAVWTLDGKTWQESSSGSVTLDVDTITKVQPVITINGVAQNPKIYNTTTNDMIGFNGTVSDGQQLVIDGKNQTMKLSGANVIDKKVGEWLSVSPGLNTFVFTVESGNVENALLQWNEVVG